MQHSDGVSDGLMDSTMRDDALTSSEDFQDSEGMQQMRREEEENGQHEMASEGQAEGVD